MVCNCKDNYQNVEFMLKCEVNISRDEIWIEIVIMH